MEMAASISKQHKLCFSTIKCPIYFTPVAWLELHVTELKLHTDSRMLSSLLRDGFRFTIDRRLTKKNARKKNTCRLNIPETCTRRVVFMNDFM